jgi:cell division protein FtsZ
LLEAMGADALLEDSFRYADDVLCQAVQGISDIIVLPGIVNVDFADVKTIMSGRGLALMGTGLAEGDNRAVEAAQRAISSPLLEETSIREASGVLINITATRESLRLQEVYSAAKIIEEVAGAEDTIFGAVYDGKMENALKVTVIATGFNQSGNEKIAGRTEHTRAAGNVVPLATSESNRSIDYQLASVKASLDEPAFQRRRAD